MFTAQLIQAINDWQRGGDAMMKAKRGRRLKQLAALLEERFRTVRAKCYRRIALDKASVFDMGDDLKLDETISSWTLDLSFAKQFKDGVPEPGWQGVIFAIEPTASQVVLNLAAVYAEEAFAEACERLRPTIKGFEHGIGRYGDSQKEVILDVEYVPIDAILALGGYSSDLPTIAAKYLGRPATDAELAELEQALVSRGRAPGAWWLEGAAKDRAVAFWIRHAKRLKPFRQ